MLIDLHATCTVMSSYKNHSHLTSLAPDSRWELNAISEWTEFQSQDEHGIGKT
jgi:hypothetical protein